MPSQLAPPATHRARGAAAHPTPGEPGHPVQDASPSAAAAALARVCAERDAAIEALNAALEQVAFLQERLRSTQAYLAEEVDVALAQERAERAALLAELVLINQELQERVQADGVRSVALPASTRHVDRRTPR